MSRPQEQLACALARHHFGPVIGEVVRLLLIEPGSTVLALVSASQPFFSKKYSESKNGQSQQLHFNQRIRLVRDALAVLIQHDLVYGTEPPGQIQPKQHSKRDAPASFEYRLFIDKLLCRSRVPLYIGFARKRYGTIGEATLRILFECGRLTSRMIFMKVLDSTLSQLGLTVSDAEACLTDMARSGLLHWSFKRFSKRKQEQGTESTNVSVGDKRPRSRDGSDDDDEDMSNSDSDSDDDGTIVIGHGDSRRKVDIPTRDNDFDVWTVCYWHLNREFRNECCVRVADSRIQDNVARSILRIGLQLALEGEDCSRPSEDFETTDIPIDDIQNLLESKDNTLPASTFWEAIQVLVSQTPSFVLPIPESAPTKLRFVPGRLIAEARQKTIEELIARRYKPAGRRVFLALAIDGGMEEKALAEKCMLPAKVVRSLVYKLYEDQLVSLQEVPRSQEQQRSSNWYYLWKVNILSASRNILDVMYKTTNNLFLRLESLNMEQGSDEDVRRAKAQEYVLVGSILRMDQSVMVMRDFGPLIAAYFPARYVIIDGPVGKVRKRQQ